jgi:hypothetical protein
MSQYYNEFDVNENLFYVYRVQSLLQRNDILRALNTLRIAFEGVARKQLVSDGQSKIIAARCSGVSSLLLDDVKDATDRDLIIYHL